MNSAAPLIASKAVGLLMLNLLGSIHFHVPTNAKLLEDKFEDHLQA